MTTPDPADKDQTLPSHPPTSAVSGYLPPSRGGGDPRSQAYASWGRRVLASLADALAVLPLIGMYVATISTVHTTYEYFATKIGDQASIFRGNGETTTSSAFWPLLITTLVVALATLIFEIWNLIVRQGRTGSSLGKQLLGIMVISEMSGTQIGASRTFSRQLIHIIDGLCLLGYLWPLWDPKRQTIADKITKTIVAARVPRKVLPN